MRYRCPDFVQRPARNWQQGQPGGPAGPRSMRQPYQASLTCHSCGLHRKAPPRRRWRTRPAVPCRERNKRRRQDRGGQVTQLTRAVKFACSAPRTSPIISLSELLLLANARNAKRRIRWLCCPPRFPFAANISPRPRKPAGAQVARFVYLLAPLRDGFDRAPDLSRYASAFVEGHGEGAQDAGILGLSRYWLRGLAALSV